MRFSLVISEEAYDDIAAITNHITTIYHAPKTALKIFQGIIATLRELQFSAAIYPIKRYDSLSHYTKREIRRINYKGFATS